MCACEMMPEWRRGWRRWRRRLSCEPAGCLFATVSCFKFIIAFVIHSAARRQWKSVILSVIMPFRLCRGRDFIVPINRRHAVKWISNGFWAQPSLFSVSHFVFHRFDWLSLLTDFSWVSTHSRSTYKHASSQKRDQFPAKVCSAWSLAQYAFSASVRITWKTIDLLIAFHICVLWLRRRRFF